MRRSVPGTGTTSMTPPSSLLLIFPNIRITHAHDTTQKVDNIFSFLFFFQNELPSLSTCEERRVRRMRARDGT